MVRKSVLPTRYRAREEAAFIYVDRSAALDSGVRDTCP